jgi:hypothetical protein
MPNASRQHLYCNGLTPDVCSLVEIAFSKAGAFSRQAARQRLEQLPQATTVDPEELIIGSFS